MGKRADVVDGTGADALRAGMVYTRRCGRVDLGHARPDGARMLWSRVRDERGMTEPGSPSHVVLLLQSMEGFGFRVATGSRFWVQKNLPLATKERVALGIYMRVSEKFEGLQLSWPFRWVTDSGFSAEDLVSNLIGFYRAVRPGPNYISMCEPVSKTEALSIWDRFGSPGVHKNHFATPFLFHRGGPECAPLPPFLAKIQLEPPGVHYGPAGDARRHE